jgi:hypothetical protein
MNLKSITSTECSVIFHDLWKSKLKKQPTNEFSLITNLTPIKKVLPTTFLSNYNNGIIPVPERITLDIPTVNIGLHRCVNNS